ncbi:MAG: OmpA family protein [Proteobacteria bacterium]|nr:OmpA family protein [Pseudomonadota bacterium]
MILKPRSILSFVAVCLLSCQLGACSTSQEQGPEESLQSSELGEETAKAPQTDSTEANLSEGNKEALQDATSSDFTDPNQVQLNEKASSIETNTENTADKNTDTSVPADASLANSEESAPLAPELTTEDSKIGSLDSSKTKTLVPFAKNSTRLNKEFRSQLRDIAQQLKSDSKLKISVAGHCDNRGSISYNRRLALKRAKAVKSYLLKIGVKSSQVQVKSFGKDQLLAAGNTEQEHAQNRRVEIEFQ